MLLPDNIQPELSIYYNGAIVIETLKDKNFQEILDLYQTMKNNNKMSYNTFTLCLDWLYLIDMIEISEKGVVTLCL